MGLLLLLITDVSGVFCSYQFSYYIRCFVFPKYLALPEPLPIAVFNPIWLPVIFIFFFWYENLYTKRLPLWEEIKITWKAAMLATISVLAIVSLGKMTATVSRTILVLTFLNGVWFFPLLRYYAKRIFFATGLNKRKVLIIGAGTTGKVLLDSYLSERGMGYEIIGFLDDGAGKAGKSIRGVKILGKISDIERYLTSKLEVIVAIPSMNAKKLIGLVNSLQKRVHRVSFIPDLLGIPFFESDMDFHFESQLLILNVRNNLKNWFNMFIKRVFDLLVSVPLMILILPVIAIIVFVIKVNSRGPAFWVEERIGRDGNNFKCIKFRSMYVNAAEILRTSLASNKKLACEWKTFFKLRKDPRVTGVGRFIRKYSLDELPQIFNIVCGDMSLVGPRPYLPREKREIGNYFGTITEVNPGLSGLWQVSGRNKKSFSERLVLDAWYIQNWSLWLDIVILIKTVKVVLKREGAY